MTLNRHMFQVKYLNLFQILNPAPLVHPVPCRTSHDFSAEMLKKASKLKHEDEE
jgi:hypothetical protein